MLASAWELDVQVPISQQKDPGLDVIAYVAASSATWVILEHASKSQSTTLLLQEVPPETELGTYAWVINGSTDYTVSLNT